MCFAAYIPIAWRLWEGKMAEFVDFEDILCERCGVKMVLARADFKYLGHSFHTEVMRCPQCKAVYIPQELAEGKIADAEMALEDK